ncbi:prepilin-type N-terminal cleavage/methylation domain protein [Acididesulfobacillus acetoxydans]|uniref:IV_pilin_GFxxxE: prepilin-type N-terminal cleavage/methylation domain n=1 Tax=Acididesulfobacillus acetoxydans TaxID=1561005 RepID=A0A8S0Y339_9FIRM|nr:prepilin-type N-terminal cleavage/methylation domain-containing protein [Acididesulfobacillus acetoxydans]CAA7601565.1 prepilin-type N-terminal cleavage/methylation domain protein [Acididesulfobacillus acetoxydans]CEJ07052.1 IV_pilin_GFxxxE: prepilin-type N-terminal cleavage/methylation domain [Acididesulfobacillus acetoxydans]
MQAWHGRVSTARKGETRTRDAGFTLIEIAIVLAVIGILALVTVPRYEGVVEHYRLASSAETVAASLREARQSAVEQRADVFVGLTRTGVQLLAGTDEEALSPLGADRSFQTGVYWDQAHSGGDYYHLQDIQAVAYQGIMFNWQGFVTPPPGATNESLRVVLRGGLGDSVEIRVEALTGSITVGWPLPGQG